MVVVSYDDDVCVSHTEVHFCVCAHAYPHTRVCIAHVHTPVYGGDGRKDGMGDSGRLCVYLRLWFLVHRALLCHPTECSRAVWDSDELASLRTGFPVNIKNSTVRF